MVDISEAEWYYCVVMHKNMAYNIIIKNKTFLDFIDWCIQAFNAPLPIMSMMYISPDYYDVTDEYIRIAEDHGNNYFRVCE